MDTRSSNQSSPFDIYKYQAFSLVELSIVLVILGLLVGGILSGQSLIRAAELRSVATEYQKFYSATMAFKDKYFAIPGDMNNAISFWGQRAAGAACITAASTDALTCNGDGSGILQPGAAASNEVFRFWQHLANAGLIEGTYDGIDHSGIASGVGATAANSPRGKISNSMWFPYYFGVNNGTAWFFDGDYGHVFEFGDRDATGNWDPAGGNLKPEEAWNIDTKTDDGKPAQGKLVVRAQNGFSTCTDAAVSTALSANYLLTGTGLNCSLAFRKQF